MAKMDPSKNGMNPVPISHKTLIMLLILKCDKRFVGDEERKIYAKHPLPFEKLILHKKQPVQLHDDDCRFFVATST